MILFFLEDSKKSYHQYAYLLECLEDLQKNLNQVGGQLYIFKGCPLLIFRYLHSLYGISSMSVQQECEPIWQARNIEIQSMSY